MGKSNFEKEGGGPKTEPGSARPAHPTHPDQGQALSAGTAAARGLTKREQEVARLQAEGKSYKMIAHELKISIHTVSTELATVRAKLHAHTAIEVLNKLSCRSGDRP